MNSTISKLASKSIINITSIIQTLSSTSSTLFINSNTPSISITSIIDKSKRKNSSASINLHLSRIFQYSCKNSIDPELMEEKAKRSRRNKVVLLPEPHKKPLKWRWSNNFTNKPKRNCRNSTECKMTIATIKVRRKTKDRNTSITSSSKMSQKNNYKIAIMTKFQEAPCRHTESQVHLNTLTKR